MSRFAFKDQITSQSEMVSDLFRAVAVPATVQSGE